MTDNTVAAAYGRAIWKLKSKSKRSNLYRYKVIVVVLWQKVGMMLECSWKLKEYAYYPL